MTLILDSYGILFYDLGTYPADEAVRMPLRVQRRDVVLHDGPVAAIALRGKHLEVVVAAIGFAIALMESLLAELLAALGAEEVLRVPGLVQRRDALVQDGAIAVGAPRAKQIVVVRFAIGEAVALEEIAGSQLLAAVVARKVLRMPGLAQGGDHLAHNGLLAGIAAALLHGIDSLATHIGL